MKRSVNFKSYKSKRSWICVTLMLLLIVSPAFSQTTTGITGTVTDESGEGIIGANITVVGNKSIGTITDINGNFNLTVPERSSIEVSYMGYTSQRFNVDGRTSYRITLKEDAKSLEEVVVVGYGQMKKATLTGAISSVTSKDIVTTKNESLLNTMTGKIAGVRIVQRTGEPGDYNNKFDIRGMGAPLVVVDGVPRDNYARIDPNEIESISVLKDASAAIYGVRAANGVVLITTKKGSATGEKFNLTYQANFGWQKPISLAHSTGAIDYMTFRNEAVKRDFNRNYLAVMDTPFNEAHFQAYEDGTRQSTDWVGLTVKNSSPSQQHTVSMNGSTQKVNYFFNLAYLTQDGITKTNKPTYERWNFRANVDAEIAKGLKTELKIAGIKDEKENITGGTWNLFKEAWLAPPTENVYANNDPLYYQNLEGSRANPVPLIDTDVTGYNVSQKRWLQSSLAISYDIPFVKGLNARAFYSYDYHDTDENSFRKEYELYEYDSAADTYVSSSFNLPQQISRSFGKDETTYMQLSLNYENSFFDKHNVKLLFLYEENSSKGDNFGAARNLNLNVPYIFAGEADGQAANMNADGLYELQRKSLIGRINYDFVSKYLFEASFRRDGSSKFSPTGRWGVFPSISVGWRLSEESFFKNLHAVSFINNFKIRASYGAMGDDSALNYQFLTGYNYPGDGGAILGGVLVNSVGIRALANPDLTWYKAKLYNVGIDTDLWNGLLGITWEYFVRNGDGIFANRLRTIPGTVGVDLPQENLNSDRNFGMELTLTHYNRINDFVYSVSANGSVARVKNRYVERAKAGNSYDNWKDNTNNRNANVMFGKLGAGQFQSYQEIYNYKINTGGGNQGRLPGDYYYQDLNGDGVIDGWDEVPIAVSGMPYVNYGITLAGGYKGIDLNLLFQGTAMSYTRYTEALAEPLPFSTGNSLDYFADRWHPVDQTANPFDPTTEWVSGYFPMVGSGNAWGEGTFGLQNASYLRLKSIELGYTFPKHLTSVIGVSNARIYFNAYNLFTITGLKYLDPEHPGGGIGKAEDDLYGYMYPLTRSVNIGFSLTF